MESVVKSRMQAGKLQSPSPLPSPPGEGVRDLQNAECGSLKANSVSFAAIICISVSFATEKGIVKGAVK